MIVRSELGVREEMSSSTDACVQSERELRRHAHLDKASRALGRTRVRRFFIKILLNKRCGVNGGE